MLGHSNSNNIGDFNSFRVFLGHPVLTRTKTRDEMKRKTNLHHGLHPVYHIRQLNIILPVSNKEVKI